MDGALDTGPDGVALLLLVGLVDLSCAQHQLASGSSRSCARWTGRACSASGDSKRTTIESRPRSEHSGQIVFRTPCGQVTRCWSQLMVNAARPQPSPVRVCAELSTRNGPSRVMSCSRRAPTIRSVSHVNRRDVMNQIPDPTTRRPLTQVQRELIGWRMTESARAGNINEPSIASQEVVVADVARQVIRRIAPDQSEYLELVIAAREQGTEDARRPWGGSGGAVRSGSELSVLADVIFPLLTGTIAQVWGAATFAKLQRKRWWRRRPKAAPAVRLVLDISRIDEAREACIEHGMTLGLSRAEATMLADAVHGVLRRSADGDQR